MVPRAARVALVALLAVALVVVGPGGSAAGDAIAGSVDTDRPLDRDGAALNTTTPTATPTGTAPPTTIPRTDTPTRPPTCTGPGCGESTHTETPTPYCTGPGCGDTPSPTPHSDPPCVFDEDLNCTPSPTPDHDAWNRLLRPLLTFLAVATIGLLAVGVVLARWRLAPADEGG